MEQTPSPQAESAAAAAGFRHIAVFFPSLFLRWKPGKGGEREGEEGVGTRAGSSSLLLKVT